MSRRRSKGETLARAMITADPPSPPEPPAPLAAPHALMTRSDVLERIDSYIATLFEHQPATRKLLCDLRGEIATLRDRWMEAFGTATTQRFLRGLIEARLRWQTEHGEAVDVDSLAAEIREELEHEYTGKLDTLREELTDAHNEAIGKLEDEHDTKLREEYIEIAELRGALGDQWDDDNESWDNIVGKLVGKLEERDADEILLADRVLAALGGESVDESIAVYELRRLAERVIDGPLPRSLGRAPTKEELTAALAKRDRAGSGTDPWKHMRKH